MLTDNFRTSLNQSLWWYTDEYGKKRCMWVDDIKDTVEDDEDNKEMWEMVKKYGSWKEAAFKKLESIK